MPESNPSKSVPALLGQFAGLLGLVTVFLYFAGWTYRWAYFGSFRLELTALELPFESFLVVPLQLVRSSPWGTAKLLGGIVLVVVLVRFTLWLLIWLDQFRNVRPVTPLSIWAKQFLDFFAVVPRVLVDELVIVVWVVVAVFVLASAQGWDDAKLDAGLQSRLPLVTFLADKNKLSIGGDIEDASLYPTLSNFGIVGDRDLLEYLRGRQINQRCRPSGPEVCTWRLLARRGGWIYLFRSLPTEMLDRDIRPPLVCVREGDGGDQLLILGPGGPSGDAP